MDSESVPPPTGGSGAPQDSPPFFFADAISVRGVTVRSVQTASWRARGVATRYALDGSGGCSDVEGLVTGDADGIPEALLT